MDENRKSRLAKQIALGIGGASFIMLIWTIVLMITNWDMIAGFIKSEFGYVLILFMVNAVISVLLGLLIISRDPGHRLGWLFLAIGFLFSFWQLSNALLEITGLEGIPALLRPIIIAGGLAYLLPLIMTMATIPLSSPLMKKNACIWRINPVVDARRPVRKRPLRSMPLPVRSPARPMLLFWPQVFRRLIPKISLTDMGSSKML